MLEVMVPCSKDGLVTNLRLGRYAREAELLLVGLANGSIHALDRPWRFRWMLLPGVKLRVAYAQERSTK